MISGGVPAEQTAHSRKPRLAGNPLSSRCKFSVASDLFDPRRQLSQLAVGKFALHASSCRSTIAISALPQRDRGSPELPETELW